MADPQQRSLQLIRYALALILASSAVVFVLMTWRWPITWDTQVMHYIDFMIGNGRAPYRQIYDMNMPGTYMFEHLGMHVFGASDVAWRVYEFFMLGLLTLGMILIAKPYDWVAGLFAGVMFSLFHGVDGSNNAVQRDEVMTVLLILAYAALFYAVRRDKPIYSGLAGILAGLAASVKPTAAGLGVAVILLACFFLRRNGKPFVQHLLLGVGGLCAAGAIVLAYLLHYQAVGPFLDLFRRVVPGYSTVGQTTVGHLLAVAISPQAFLFLFLALAAMFFARRENHAARPFETWESSALWLGALFGLASFIVQHKGYPYHRYPTVAFVLLWAAIQAFSALRVAGAARAFAITGLAYMTLIVIPQCLVFIRHFPDVDYFSTYLEQDLQRIGTQPLQYRIQCMDLVYGCMNALYHDRIMMLTGATGDLLFFQPEETAAVRFYRDQFWQSMEKSPPAAFVVTNQWYGQEASFKKLEAWPAFAQYLQQNYVLTTQREFNGDQRPTSHPGSDSVKEERSYRIYIRKDSALLAIAQRADGPA